MAEFALYLSGLVYEDLPGKPTSFSGGMKGCFA
jgi:hypothetical protein